MLPTHRKPTSPGKILLTQLAPYLARELSEIHEIQDFRRSQGDSPWQGEKRSRSCVAASLFGQ
jgi:hypothetical protein